MLAGVPNLAAPQDNVLSAYLIKHVLDHKNPFFLSGGNFALECVIQRGNSCDYYDTVNMKDINKKHGRNRINRLQLITHYWRSLYKRKKTFIEFRPLNYIMYRRVQALEALREFCDFEDYSAKHLENYLAGFLQLYWLPRKFGVDKRTSHLSSMIVSGQMSREEALNKLNEPLYDEEWIKNATAVIKRELDFSDAEFEAVMAAPTRQHSDYKMDRKIEIALSIAQTPPFSWVFKKR